MIEGPLGYFLQHHSTMDEVHNTAVSIQDGLELLGGGCFLYLEGYLGLGDWGFLVKGGELVGDIGLFVKR